MNSIFLTDMLSVIAGMALGYFIGISHHCRARRDLKCQLIRKLQLIAVRNEMLTYRAHRKRPLLNNWQRCLLGWLYRISPTLTRYTSFRPETFIRWHRQYVKRWWWIISRVPKKAGRPRIDPSVVQLILEIKAHNPRYGSERITSMINQQLQISISEASVRHILKSHKSKPTNSPQQSWKTFLSNHRPTMASMDFKVVFDWRAKPLYILNIIDHARRQLRRQLICCEPTYTPSSEWIAQQLRNAYPFDEAPKEMLMDRDSIFLPIASRTLPNMGVKVVKCSVRSPWQNGIVERFNRTLKEELLNHIIPMGVGHLSRLLKEYQSFYNTARPHQANDGQSPIHSVESANDSVMGSATNRLSVEAVVWLGGLHHSYRRAA